LFSILRLLTVVVLAFAATSCGTIFDPFADPIPRKAHQWGAVTEANHIPLQGLTSFSHLVAVDDPIQFVNFYNKKERDAARAQLTASGAAVGAVEWCIAGYILCPVTALVGAALRGAENTVSEVSEEEAERIGAQFEKISTSAIADEIDSRLVQTSNQQMYPQLIIKKTIVLLAPTPDGVSFFIIVEAQGVPDPENNWEPTKHLVQLPIRTVDNWLANESYQLKNDLQTALSILSENIVDTYHPY